MITMALLALAQTQPLDGVAAADLPYTFVISLDHIPADDQAAWLAVVNFSLASASQQRVAELCTLQPTEAPGRYLIDVRNLKWSGAAFTKALADYPYAPKLPSSRPGVRAVPKVIRGDWLALQIWDTTSSQVRYLLLYGRADITRDQWLAIHDFDKGAKFAIGAIEGQSGVTVPGGRRVILTDERRAWLWTTLDTKQAGKGDPLEQPDSPFRLAKGQPAWLDPDLAIHDGSEHIAALYKHSIKSTARGHLSDYLLANAAGQVVQQGPTDLVFDRTAGFRRLAEIRLGSCVTCHTAGLNYPTSDEYRLFRGARILKRNKALDLAAFYAPLTTKIEQYNAGYAAGVRLITGLAPAEFVPLFARCFEWYDHDLSPDQAAAELGTSRQILTLSLASLTSGGYDIGARLSNLAEGQPIPRAAFELHYLTALKAVIKWKSEHPLP